MWDFVHRHTLESPAENSTSCCCSRPKQSSPYQNEWLMTWGVETFMICNIFWMPERLFFASKRIFPERAIDFRFES